MNLEIIRKAGKLNTEAIQFIWDRICAGDTLKQADEAVRIFLEERGAKPAFLGYMGYPASSCISVNNQIVHAIPTDYKPQQWDLIKIDMGVLLDSWNVDAAKTFLFAPIEHVKGRVLVSPPVTLQIACQMILEAGTKVAIAGNSLFDIAVAMGKVANCYGVHIFPNLGGHYIGRTLHEDPWIPMNPKAATAEHVNHKLKMGDLICLEPIVTFDRTDTYNKDSDGWTLTTIDGSLSTHFEHTLLITDKEPEIIC